MPAENIQRRKKQQRTTFVVVPGGESQTKSFSVSKTGIFSSAVVFVLFIMGLTLVMVIYTPLGIHLPIINPELENKYEKQVVEIKEKLEDVMIRLVATEEYNVKLRRVLGEKISRTDSSLHKQGTNPSSSVTKLLEGAPSEPEGQQQSAKTSGVSPRTLEKNQSVAGNSFHAPFSPQQDFALTMPTLGYLTRGYEIEQGHYGIDYAGKEGSPVVAAANGNIIFADWTYDFGYMIIIAHNDGYTTVYKHNQTLVKNVSASVKRGEIIALLGNTGRTSAGPHVHFEIWKDGVPLNPTNYLITSQ